MKSSPLGNESSATVTTLTATVTATVIATVTELLDENVDTGELLWVQFTGRDNKVAVLGVL